MAIKILKLQADVATFFSPLSGKPAFTENGANTRDPNLLFVYVGDVCEWAHVAKPVRELVKKAGKDLDDLEPADLCRMLKIPGAVCLEVDAGFSGRNWAAWAPPKQD